MAFNGSGTFVRLFSWVQDAANGIDISSTRTDEEMDGFATGLSTCITKDGQTTPTANLPMGGFLHTNVGNATVRTNYPSAAQVQDGGLLWCGTASGTANAITVISSPVTTAHTTGQVFRFVIATTNTAAVTFNPNAIGTKNILKTIGASLVALVQGDLPANAVAEVIYDGTQYQLLNVQPFSHGADIASATTTNLDTATGDLVDVTGTTAITAITLSEGRSATVRFTGILTLTNGASLVLPSGANITTAAGDYAVFRGYASSVVRCIVYSKASGLAVVGSTVPSFAAKADMQAATSTTLVINPAQTQNHPGVAKCAVNFTISGTTLTTQEAYGCTIARTSAGLVRVTFITAFANTKYQIVALGGINAGNSAFCYSALAQTPNKTTAHVDIQYINTSNAVDDPSEGSIVIFGTQ